ncbi:hypothetical protein RchiOBHm_Chr6g0290921 [Rosa chinensis]|uniref:Uncharacterized protein n=1 Tax=Rosa chinensis TaxID=74649 RepID=A0A2P6PVZ2_ROSCH|nr:hypothetical protein RchiOBHm_Chr6g0290921 [Rosa chinensis]
MWAKFVLCDQRDHLIILPMSEVLGPNWLTPCKCAVLDTFHSSRLTAVMQELYEIANWRSMWSLREVHAFVLL